MITVQAQILEWITSQYEQYSLHNQRKVSLDSTVYVKIEELADEPEIYIRATNNGLEFGYKAMQWDGYIPASSPIMYKEYSLNWDLLQLLSSQKQQEAVLKLLMKTINTRKKQYRKCQFCTKKIAVEHHFDKDTCHSCASKHFGVVY